MFGVNNFIFSLHLFVLTDFYDFLNSLNGCKSDQTRQYTLKKSYSFDPVTLYVQVFGILFYVMLDVPILLLKQIYFTLTC